MRGHDWKKVLPTINMGEDYLFKLGSYDKPISSEWQAHDPNADVDYRPGAKKVWKCSRCGSVITAFGDEKMSHARRKHRVPFDCDMVLVAQVHKS
jgi:hypothetical protein